MAKKEEMKFYPELLFYNHGAKQNLMLETLGYADNNEKNELQSLQAYVQRNFRSLGASLLSINFTLSFLGQMQQEIQQRHAFPLTLTSCEADYSKAFEFFVDCAFSERDGERTFNLSLWID